MRSNIIASFKDKKVLLVGDSILDIYTHSRVIGQTPYATAPEIEEIESKIFFGGNGLIASNILELGGKVYFISIVGNDSDAKFYNSFKHANLKKFFLIDKTRKTTVKRRWYTEDKVLLQANQVDNHPINTRIENRIIQIINKNIKKVDVIVIMDPQHGVMTKNLIRKILQLSNKNKKPLYVDSQISHRPSNHHLYKGVDTMFLNQKEAKAVYPKLDEQKFESALQSIKSKFDLKNIIIKLGEKGSVALWGNKIIKSPPYNKVKTVDVCGAGDAFLAAFSLGDREKPEETLEIANKWAGLSTAIYGTMAPKKKDLMI